VSFLPLEYKTLKIFRKVSLMIKTTISLLIGASLTLLAPQLVHARGCGGARTGGGSYSGSRSYSGGSEGRYGGASGSYNRSYEGSHGGSVDASGTRGAAYGPGGAAAGSTRDVSATGPKGQTYNSQEERGAAAGPNGAVAGGSRSTSATGANGQSYSGQREGAAAVGPSDAAAAGTYHGTTTGAAHAALPTDAGYGASAVRAGSGVYARYHQTEAVSGGVYAARGTAVRGSFNGYGMYGAAWRTANPGAWAAGGWRAGYAWTPATWPAIGVSLGWAAGVAPFAYNYGSDVTYQDGQVYYGSEPVATAEQYYQQASTLAQTAPAAAAAADDWLPLGVFALVQKEQSDPQFIMQLAVNKSGAIAGNYSDLISGTNVTIQGAVDKKSQRAAWTVGKNKNTVCETGLYNLTKDEAPALIHIGKDRTQQWMLVRLKQPEQAGGG
jgi:hypothetical protein